ncbi:MAG: polysaccharide export protein [candidate division Zixibacteria bacterium]|nr:polysaccharide export protein [candidate division Zixibacteria bacterium]
MSRTVFRQVSMMLTACALVTIMAGAAGAKDYLIGPDDVLDIRFWQKPQFNATVRVDAAGKIALDILGQTTAAGKTIEELQNDIVRLISRFDKDISQVVVRVATYNYNYVYVTGQARTPGKRSFEEIPDLWTIINEAGGANELGDLSRVTIIRGGADAGKIEYANVSEALATGRLDQLPKIRREDTIEIPRSPASIPQPSLAQGAAQKNFVYVVGAVMRPGPVEFQENSDLLDLLALAGGPTPTADLKKSKLITKDGYYAQTLQVNLDEYAKTGRPARYIVRKEDTFVVPVRSAGFLGGSLGTVAAVAGTATTIFLLIDRFTNNDNRVR